MYPLGACMPEAPIQRVRGKTDRLTNITSMDNIPISVFSKPQSIHLLLYLVSSGFHQAI